MGKAVLLVVYAAEVVLLAALVAESWRMWPTLCPQEAFKLQPAPAGMEADRCRLSGDISRDLREKGFTVVSGFMSNRSLKHYMDVYDSLSFNNLYGGSKGVSLDHALRIWNTQPQEMKDSISEMGRKIGDETGIRPDWDYSWMEFITNTPENPAQLTGWHQDQETFSVFHDGLDHYLNLYILLDKPDPDDAGLEVVPFDTLRARSPAFHDFVNGSTRKDFRMLDSKRMAVAIDDQDAVGVLNFTLDEVACAPKVTTGDLLLMRGDTIHRAQKAVRNRRTSVAARVGRKAMNLENMLGGGLFRRLRVVNLLDTFLIWYAFGLRGPSIFTDPLPPSWTAYFAYVRLRITSGLQFKQLLLKLRLLTGGLVGERRDCDALFFQAIPHLAWARSAR